MKPFNPPTWTRWSKTIMILIFCCIGFNAPGQKMAYILDDENFLRFKPRRPLEANFDPGTSPGNGPVGSVGGVALTATAQPASTLSFDSITLHYDPNLPDGFRLLPQFDGNPITTFIPDWLLIPIIKFADSEYNSAVSLFGPETTNNPLEYDIVYHEAFSNSLLGLRLLQSDILFISLSKFWKAPRWKDGASPLEVHTGHGEEIPVETDYWIIPNNEMVQIFWDSELIAMEAPPTSWLLSDIQQEVSFDIVQNELIISGSPYYYFWNYDNTGEVSEVEYLTEMMRLETQENGAVHRYNPFVYEAVVTTMRYAAFFRYVKANFPDTWENLLNAIEGQIPEPDVLTPSFWAPIITNIKVPLAKDGAQNIKTYPNPTMDLFNLELTDALDKEVQISIYNISGQLVLTPGIFTTHSGAPIQIDIAPLPPGIYFTKVFDGRQVVVGRIIKH